MPSPEKALEDVLALSTGELATGKHVYVLTGQATSFATFQSRARESASKGETYLIEGNGWRFRKLNPDEMKARHLAPKAASWEVIEYGND